MASAAPGKILIPDPPRGPSPRNQQVTCCHSECLIGKARVFRHHGTGTHDYRISTADIRTTGMRGPGSGFLSETSSLNAHNRAHSNEHQKTFRNQKF